MGCVPLLSLLAFLYLIPLCFGFTFPKLNIFPLEILPTPELLVPLENGILSPDQTVLLVTSSYGLSRVPLEEEQFEFVDNFPVAQDVQPKGLDILGTNPDVRTLCNLIRTEFYSV